MAPAKKVRLKSEPPKRRRARWPSGVRFKRDAHAVEQVDDLRGPVAHLEDGWLVGQEIAAEDGLVEVHPLGVSLLASDVVAGVDAALRADAVGALHGDHGEQVDIDALFGELDGAGEARQATADDDHAFIYSCHDDSLIAGHF